MEKDIIKKIAGVASKHRNINEADIRSMMILVRKFLDAYDQNSFLILRLYCNWVAHNEITKSNTGLRVLAEINNTLVKVKSTTDTNEMQNLISQAIGYPLLRNELKTVFGLIGIDNTLITVNNVWSVFINHLIEIIRDVPLSFPPLSNLDPAKLKIYEKISNNPIKEGAGVISIQLSNVDYDELGAENIGEILCIIIKTEDTTTVVIPFTVDATI
ncbi:MAG: hypothetical protein IIA06_10080 [Proteobacteria bacterium]|nr:hypothetical protein [Pseudomonadota bacterium]